MGGHDKHIATYTVKVPPGKPPAKVVVTLNLDRNCCVFVQSAVVMEPIVAEERKTEADGDEKKDDKEEKKEGTEEKKESVEPPAPPKKKFSKTPLQFECETFGLDDKAVKDALELEASMANEDRLITETADRRNELESYIYGIRDKLIGVYKKFATDAELASMNSSLQDTEDWLYGDGFDSVKSEYKKKLDELKVTGDKIEFRFFESENRTSAVDGLKKQIELCKSCEDWIYDLLGKQGDLPDNADPVLTGAAIQAKRNSLFTVTNPIMMKKKPKPEPKPVPPEETKAEEGKSENKEGEAKGGEGKDGDAGEGKNGGGEAPMDDGAAPGEENKGGDDNSKMEE